MSTQVIDSNGSENVLHIEAPPDEKMVWVGLGKPTENMPGVYLTQSQVITVIAALQPVRPDSARQLVPLTRKPPISILPSEWVSCGCCIYTAAPDRSWRLFAQRKGRLHLVYGQHDRAGELPRHAGDYLMFGHNDKDDTKTLATMMQTVVSSLCGDDRVLSAFLQTLTPTEL